MLQENEWEFQNWWVWENKSKSMKTEADNEKNWIMIISGIMSGSGRLKMEVGE